MPEFEIIPITREDENWVAQILMDHWGAPVIISCGQSHDASKLPGFIAFYQGEKVGLVTYRVTGQECELVTLDSWQENMGVGSSLVEAVKRAALKAGCSRLCVITTNDNLKALGFYQKRGLHISAVYPNALAKSRKIKPAIPAIGLNGIPLRDEIQLEIALKGR